MKQTPGSVLLELVQFIVVGTEVAFLVIGPVSIHVTYREGRVFDASCLLVAWVLVVAHFLYLWHAKRKSGS